MPTATATAGPARTAAATTAPSGTATGTATAPPAQAPAGEPAASATIVARVAPVPPVTAFGSDAYAVPQYLRSWRLLAVKATPEPTARPVLPTATSNPNYAGLLPGLSYVKLVSYWQGSLPLECQGPITAKRQLVWNCNLVAGDGSAQLTMLVFAASGDNLSRISISVVQLSPAGKATADRWLAHAAGTPMITVPLEQVKAWLEELGEGSGSLRAGQVKYSIHRLGTERTFDIVPAPTS